MADTCNHDHEHGHHHHSHSLGHVHAPSTFGWAFLIGVILNTSFVVGEVVFGARSNSMALLSDAGHNLGDVLGLLAAWGASVLATRTPTRRHTYGYRRSPELAALFNGAILLFSTGAIICESVRRLFSSQPVEGGVVMVVAAIGIAVNLSTALMFAFGSKDDINVRGAITHMLGDAAVAFGVVIAGVAIRLTHLALIDPIVSIVVATLVLVASWKLLKEALNLAMDAVPASVDFEEVRHYLLALPGVTGVHDLHIWSMGTSECALTAHIVCPEGAKDEFICNVAQELDDRFGIHHPTLQIENGSEDAPCRSLCTVA